MVLNGAIAPNVANVERGAHLHQKPMRSWQKRRFIPKMAKAKNALASGVRWSAWFGFSIVITFPKGISQ